MPLATPLVLGSLTTVAVLGWCLSAAFPAWQTPGRWILAAGSAPVVLWTGYHGAAAALENPQLAGTVVLVAFFGPALVVAVAAVVMTALLLLGVRLRRRSTEQDGEDDDGGGGSRRPTPAPPRRPTPPSPAPAGPPAPWDQFDDLRSQWERVPVGPR